MQPLTFIQEIKSNFEINAKMSLQEIIVSAGKMEYLEHEFCMDSTSWKSSIHWMFVRQSRVRHAGPLLGGEGYLREAQLRRRRLPEETHLRVHAES